MKKFTFLSLFLLLLILAGCQSNTIQKTDSVVLPTPSSNGPDAPPSVNGPTTSPLENLENKKTAAESDAPQAITERDEGTYTLQPQQ